MKNFIVRITGALFAIITGVTTPGVGCSTPVFRYALEMWAAYAYRVEVTHDGNLNAEQKQALEYLKGAASSAVPANLKVIETVMDQPADPAERKLPVVRLLFPEADQMDQVIWKGALTRENAEKIVGSPARKKLVERIRKGDATVWLFLPGGQEDRDEGKQEILHESLERLSRELKLSETATDINGNPLDIKIINTGVHFSMVPIDINDPAEEVFIKMLLATEPDLKFFKNTPMAFPVFGRGRELYALIGGGINYKNIEKACSTVIGWCSCTIKDDNPGIDLLVRADWNLAVGDSSWIQPEQLPEITGISDFAVEANEQDVKPEAAQPNVKAEKVPVTTRPQPEQAAVPENRPAQETVTEETVTASVSAPAAKPEPAMSPLLRNALIAMLLLLVVIISASFLLKRI